MTVSSDPEASYPPPPKDFSPPPVLQPQGVMSMSTSRGDSPDDSGRVRALRGRAHRAGRAPDLAWRIGSARCGKQAKGRQIGTIADLKVDVRGLYLLAGAKHVFCRTRAARQKTAVDGLDGVGRQPRLQKGVFANRPNLVLVIGRPSARGAAQLVSQAWRADRPRPPPPARALRARRSKLLLGRRSGAKMTPAQNAEAQRMAREWRPKSCADSAPLIDINMGAPRLPVSVALGGGRERIV